MMTSYAELEDAVTGQVGALLPSLVDYSLHRSDDARSLPAQARECRDDFGIVSQYPMAEHYADGHLSVILNVTAKRNGNAVGQQRSSSGECVDIDLPVFILQFQAINRNNGRHWDEQMVFVVNVEIVKGANIAVPVPSSVRFYSIHKQLKQCRTANYFTLGYFIPARRNHSKANWQEILADEGCFRGRGGGRLQALTIGTEAMMKREHDNRR
jgi:hypothetical protein